MPSSDFSPTPTEYSENDDLKRGLVYAALSPGLRSVLVFNAAPAALRTDARQLAHMLEVATGHTVAEIVLGASESEEDLWGGFAFPHPGSDSGEERRTHWQPGILFGERRDAHLRLVVIPDLTRLSLAASRACIALIGKEVVHLERNGQSVAWKPDLCWLAACPADAVGTVSPHLLDRFALRLHARPPRDVHARAVEVQAWLEGEANAEEEASPPGSAAFHIRLKEVVDSPAPVLTIEALVHVHRAFTGMASPGMRRQIALARLAVAVARFSGAAQVEPEHVQRSLEILCSPSVAAQEVYQSVPQVEPKPMTPDTNSRPFTPVSRSGAPSSQANSELEQTSTSDAGIGEVINSAAPTEVASFPVALSALQESYPEDTAHVTREAASLRLPTSRYGTEASRGVIIGVEAANDLGDLALTSTLLEAAKFQHVRRKHMLNPTPENLLPVSQADLRRYRRAPTPERMLVLLIDYTSLRFCDWTELVAERLRQAYVDRASVCLVRVGAADNRAEELRAERIIARSVLSPLLRAKLDGDPGTATPLAHGLDLAIQTMRHALQHGRQAIVNVEFVVLTDGRGNVPLVASRAGYLTGPVNREGIEDVLHIAQSLHRLHRVRTVLLDPQPLNHSELPTAIAQALGALVEPIPPLAMERG